MVVAPLVVSFPSGGAARSLWSPIGLQREGVRASCSCVWLRKGWPSSREPQQRCATKRDHHSLLCPCAVDRVPALASPPIPRLASTPRPGPIGPAARPTRSHMSQPMPTQLKLCCTLPSGKKGQTTSHKRLKLEKREDRSVLTPCRCVTSCRNSTLRDGELFCVRCIAPISDLDPSASS